MPFTLGVNDHFRRRPSRFLDIALADLTLDHRTQPRLRDTLRQLAGIATIALIRTASH